MVALRKMMGGDAPPMGEGAESAEEMLVQCPGCGCEFVPEAEKPAMPEGEPTA